MTKTFTSFDKFDLKPFADKLTNYLQVESKFVEESYVLSLNSEFGSGKSTFFEMWSNELQSADDIFKVVYVNAWESDFQGDPLLAIASCLLEHLQPVGSQEAETIKETVGKLGKLSLSIGNDVVQKVTGIDMIKAGQYAESRNGIAKVNSGRACFDLYQEKCELFEELKTELRNFTGNSNLPILVMVDELDRCRPDYAIEFLETIKHFFDIHGLIFVLGVDKSQLASSAKSLFGQDLVFDEYYRKFAHRNASLPVKNQIATKGFCQKLAEEYLSEEAFNKRKRFPYAKHDRHRTDDVVKLCTAFSLNARQMHEFFRIAAHVFSIAEKSGSQLMQGWHIGTFFMVALSIKNQDLYNQIGQRSISLSEFTAFLSKLGLFKNDEDYGLFGWAALLFIGAFGNQPSDQLEKQFQALGVWGSTDNDEEAFKNELGRYEGSFFSWGRGGKLVFPEIYNILEGLRTFVEK